MHGGRDADAARVGQRLEPRRDVHPFAVDPLALGADVSEVNADPELHLALCGEVGVSTAQNALDLDCALHSVECARELGQEVVAGEIHEPTAVLAHEELDLLAVVAQDMDGGAFVLGHQPGVPDDIGAHDGR